MYHFSTSLGGTEMAKAKDAGVFKMENGLWAYRFAIMIDGKQVARRKSTDEHGNKLHTKKEAIRAREAAIEQAHLERNRQKKLSRRTSKKSIPNTAKMGGQTGPIRPSASRTVFGIITCVPGSEADCG